MAQHTSAGARPYTTGLVVQSKPEIDTNEFGLKQGTLRFLLANTLWPALEPARATPCSSFTAGDARTATYLTSIPFMGAQTSRWTYNGHCPGIGILEVLCQGAKFDPAYESGAVTRYFFQSTTTLEDLNFTIYDAPLSGGATTNLSARLATTTDLNAHTFVSQGKYWLQGNINGQLSVDGSSTDNSFGFGIVSPIPPIAPGNAILVKNQTNPAQNGLYIVNLPGTMGLNPNVWNMYRAPSMDEPSEFVATVQVSVTDGATQAGSSWLCAPAGGTFVVNSTGVTFTGLVAAGANPATPLYNVHIQYHSIDLHFEYMAVARQQTLRYIQSAYAVSTDNLVSIGGGLLQTLAIEKVEAQKLTSASPTVWAAIDDSIWRAAVFFPGTAGRLEQNPAGQYFHVLETASVKIQAISPSVGSIV